MSWGERTYDVVGVKGITLDDFFHLLDRRCFHDEQRAIHLLLSTGENGFGGESWSEDLCHIARNSSTSPNHKNTLR